MVIRKSIVNSDQMTGESQLCTLIYGTVRRVPVAKVHVNTPYYVEDVDALCMDKPVYDFIVATYPESEIRGIQTQKQKKGGKYQDTID